MKMHREQRRQVVLSAALKVAREKGLASVTYENVARACEVETSAATVRRYAGRIAEMQKKAVLRAGGSLRAKLREEAKRLGVPLDNLPPAM